MEFLAHDIRVPQDVEYDDFVRRVREFTVYDMLKFCNQVACWLADKSPAHVLLRVPVSSKYHCPLPARIYLTQWMVAFIAKTSILHSTDRMHGWLKPANFLGLAYMYANMRDAYTRDVRAVPGLEGAKGMLVRTSWEQFGYQGRMNRDIPRAWLLLIEGSRTIQDPPMNLEEEFRAFAGIDLEKFMTVGFGYYAGLCSYKGPYAHQSVVRHFPATGAMKDKISPDECERFLCHAAATYDEFRELSVPRIKDHRYVKTEFNVLLSRPLIAVGKEILCPVPRLVMHRITEGLIFDLMNHFRNARTRNPFREYFGRLFEHYVGRLLKWSYGEDAVYFEPRYGKPEKAGPDWVVLDEDTAILIECRTSSMRLETKVFGEIESVTDDINRMVFETVRRFPSKIADLRAGITAIDTSRVVRYECVVLLYERVFFEFIYRDAVRELFKAKGEKAFEDYCLMDIAQFELLSSWHKRRVRMKDVLSARPQTVRTGADRDFRKFLHEFQVERHLPDEHPLLNKVLDDFFLANFGIQEPAGGHGAAPFDDAAVE